MQMCIGAETDTVLSDAEAIKLVSDKPYDIILLDVMMPDMNGIETTLQIREIVGNDVPILLVSAYDWSDLENEAKEFMRFLVNTEELNRMAKAKRMVTPCTEMAFDDIYAAFGQLDASHVINQSELGLNDAPDQQVRKAGWQVSNGNMTVDEAVAAFGTLN